jgi:hypothetical protein
MSLEVVQPRPALQHLFEDAGESSAVELLRDYFTPLPTGRFSGAHFESFGGGGDRPAVANTFTADDLVAVTTLGVTLSGDAAIALLETRSSEFSELLGPITVERAFAELTFDDIGEDWAVRAAYRSLITLPGVGQTKATKLLARKRPHLVPIQDSVITAELGVTSAYWKPLHRWLTDNGAANAARLEHLREQAGLGLRISVLRTFDVLAWRVGSGKTTIRTHSVV